jgi:hypothetical protein
MKDPSHYVKPVTRQLDIDNTQAQQISFDVEGMELDSVDSFRYLGCPIVTDSSDWLAVNYNLKKARGRWSQVSCIITRQHINPKTSGFFYKAVAQAVLLYGCEAWTIS